MFSNKVFWGNREKPYLRIRIENATNPSIVYADRNMSLTMNGTTPSFSVDYNINGETGLNAPGTVGTMYSVMNWESTTPAGTLPVVQLSGSFTPGTQMKVILYYPGGDHCGTTVAPYQRVFPVTIASHSETQLRITSIENNCAGLGSYFKVNFNLNYHQFNIKLIDPSPYTVLTNNTGYLSNSTSYSLNYSPLVVGKTYRVVIADTCGRSDSMEVVYTPSVALSGPPAIVDTIRSNFKCPVNPYDTLYQIIIKPLPAGYTITGITLNGFGSVSYPTIPNWNGTSQSAYLINKLLPPGTYTYNISWVRNCSNGVVSQPITISPSGSMPEYRASLNLSVATSTLACGSDGYRGIRVDGWLKNVNTSYLLSNLRLTGVPGSYVFPMLNLNNQNVNMVNQMFGFSTMTVGDTIKLAYSNVGLKINTGQEGTYTFSIDVRCPDGTVIETITRSITVTSAPLQNSSLDLKYANALVCSSLGSFARINMLPQGGIRPFVYEYKLDSDMNFNLTTNSGADSIVVLDPAPAPGTIYDIRVTDACGVSRTSKVSIGSFTGNFYITDRPLNCVTHPFGVRLQTSMVNGAYYRWRRNGTVIAQGTNLFWVHIAGVYQDTITVDINLFDCYSSNASRVLSFSNPCNYIILDNSNISLGAKRLTNDNVQVNWKTTTEKDIQHFELEKSYTSSGFSFVSRHHSTKTDLPRTVFTNDKEDAPIVFYRLKAISNSHQVYYSNIVKVDNTVAQSVSGQVRPNPATSFIKIALKGLPQSEKKVLLKFYSEKGQMVKSIQLSPNELDGNKEIDISALAAGSYFITVNDNWNAASTLKFIKQ